MAKRTIIHPRQGANSTISTYIKNGIFAGHVSQDQLIQTFPSHLTDDMDIDVHNRENILAASYNANNTYFIKVISTRHLKVHHYLTRWRNTIFKINQLPQPFESFTTPMEMAEYEYNAITHTADTGGEMPTAHKYAEIPDTSHAAILYEFIPNNGKFTDETKSLKAFDHILQTLRILHNGGYTHTSVPDHILQTIPTGAPCITDPIGRVTDTDESQLLGIGFDLAALLTRYTPTTGALPLLKRTSEYYSDVELIAAYNATKALRLTIPNTSTWVVRQLRSSINEYANTDAVETYNAILEIDDANLQNHDYKKTPYTTDAFVDKVEQQTIHQRTTQSTDDQTDDTQLGLVNNNK